MKITLNKEEQFWSLIDPSDIMNTLVVLNSNQRSEVVDFDSLPEWGKKQIQNSDSSGIISTNPPITVAKVAKTVKKVNKNTKKKAKAV